MCRVFAYCRVSTDEQTVENQILAIRKAGYEVDDGRVISETISGTTKAMERPAFKNLIDNKIEKGDSLIVNRLDRLGHSNVDLQGTIELLTKKGIKVVCLDLPIPDLSSSEGKLMLQMFSAFAEFERNRISERTKDGLKRARAQGKQVGRPQAIKTTEQVQELKAKGLTQVKVAKELGISERTVMRHWNKKA